MTQWRVRAQAHVGELRLAVDIAGDDAPLMLIGPNGSGKTTLLRVIMGLVPPTEATITVGDRTLVDTAAGIDRRVETRGVGYVPQGYGLFPNMTVLDNVAFGLSVRTRKLGLQQRHARARAALADMECAELAERMPEGLSGGEQQRVAVARALVTQPALLLFDEPLAALDAATRRSIRAFLATHLRQIGCPSIIVTHEPRDVLALDADVVVLGDGKVVQRGSLDTLRRDPTNAFVAEFVACLNEVAPPRDAQG